MNTEEFLEKLTDILQKDETCTINDMLNDYEEWDSLSKISIIAFYDKEFNQKVSLEDIENAQSIQDLINLAGDNLDV